LKKLRPYFLPVVILATSLLTLGYRVVRQVILPTLTRKGNLLSSLFVLFTEIIEQVISFAEAVARVPRAFALPATLDRTWAYSRNYLRQGMLIATWSLFILSSVEWSSNQPIVTEQTTVVAAAHPTAGVSRSQLIFLKSGAPAPAIAPRLLVYPPVNPPLLSTPRWLLLCTVRV
jgi:hypothetical protein